MGEKRISYRSAVYLRTTLSIMFKRVVLNSLCKQGQFGRKRQAMLPMKSTWNQAYHPATAVRVKSISKTEKTAVDTGYVQAQYWVLGHPCFESAPNVIHTSLYLWALNAGKINPKCKKRAPAYIYRNIAWVKHNQNIMSGMSEQLDW